MPRSSRSGGGRSAPSGSRGSHSMAGQRSQQSTQPATVPSHNAQVPAHQQQQQSRSPGFFGQMASTAGGVALGHGLSNMLFGGGSGGSSEPAPEAQSTNAPAQWNDQGFKNSQSSGGASCEVQSKDFLRCLDATNNNMDSCAYYLDQLKQCQAMARPY